VPKLFIPHHQLLPVVLPCRQKKSLNEIPKAHASERLLVEIKVVVFVVAQRSSRLGRNI